jgi:maltose alpha-D-glucosyltransferase/alpha-amylase
MIDRGTPDWYKDAVIYQLHVKSFFDANDDGIGDFDGLVRKLDYIKSLGVTAVWLLPFYPSPLRDDGYDIADYRNVNPSYGTLRGFKQLVREAHRRDLRVVTELVVNHTSDQHPWFQRARRAKPGSSYRDFYVWSDTDRKYQGTRIIFLDTESSNWAWDPVAQAYYWHRFYSHQPDLNFENPRVLREILNVLRYWLDMGVDGLRLDAVPYLREREGTNNENLPETHDILKRIRAEVDRNYPDRMLLAEANQWPEDAQEYFGDGDECHMSFHFPLMPRMYMALAQEDRHPITDIIRQTPDIPDGCQWAIFLRNHDELTLEMVTDRERDYLWNFYAADRRMRLNLGIRRRLMPLMERDRRKVEAMTSMLLSMPGTPILYYGDEIGMGDNIYVGDRDGVRTPMQWSPDRNGGFSRCDPQKLFLPAIMDPVYGFEAVNVEAQQRDSASLLNWTRRVIAVRQSHPAFGRGTLRFLYPGNRKILTYLRESGDEALLCVVNLSRSAQAAELDLSAFAGRVPVEMLGGAAFPPIGELPYLLTVTGYGFYWFVLAREAQIPRWHAETPEPLPEYVTLVTRRGWSDLLGPRNTAQLERDVLPAYLPNQRWFTAKDDRIERVSLASWTCLGSDDERGYLLAQIAVELRHGGSQDYFLPLAMSFEPGAAEANSPLRPFVLAQVRRGSVVGAVYDAVAEPGFTRVMVVAMFAGRRLGTGNGQIVFTPTGRFRAAPPDIEGEVRRLSVEQSNSSTRLGEEAVLKIYRRPVPGVHPEVELGRFLTDVAGFANTPPLLGTAELVDAEGTPSALGVLHGFVANQGDGWSFTLDYLTRWLEEDDDPRAAGGDTEEKPTPFGLYMPYAEALGRRTGELHGALRSVGSDDPAFAPEAITDADLATWRAATISQAESAFAAVEQAHASLSAQLRERVNGLLARRLEATELVERLTDTPVAAQKTRTHGDYHLGQTLVAQDDIYILDFEGEPARPLEERRRKSSPLRDVAGMLRSFDYAAWAAVRKAGEHSTVPHGEILSRAMNWRDAVSARFKAAYDAAVAGTSATPAAPTEADRLLHLFLLEKAFYEVRYESANRPDWLAIPVNGLLDLLETAGGHEGPG